MKIPDIAELAHIIRSNTSYDRLRAHTFKCIAEHRDLFIDLVVLGDLADAAARPHQRDGSVLRIGETLVDVLLNVEHREIVDPAT